MTCYVELAEPLRSSTCYCCGAVTYDSFSPKPRAGEMVFSVSCVGPVHCFFFLSYCYCIAIILDHTTAVIQWVIRCLDWLLGHFYAAVLCVSRQNKYKSNFLSLWNKNRLQMDCFVNVDFVALCADFAIVFPCSYF